MFREKPAHLVGLPALLFAAPGRPADRDLESHQDLRNHASADSLRGQYGPERRLTVAGAP
ncbi:hypothetical protein SCWH03_31560 [Streptomyces pacificus]|uniref:Uncharacterized protein n=1 Tax=Streptomyces pacificus TaxID=2705029 RepID=A0A6A0AX36_9ACTN|nr:hypothetical protein SCWH03_31560 [Streptomyces pacificus]